MKKAFIFLVMLTSLLVLNSCGPSSGWYAHLSVPYFGSTTNRSAPHCIAMWSAGDGRMEPEEDIWNFLGYGFSFIDIEFAIFLFTEHTGWQAIFPNNDEGQNMALSAVSSSLENDSPSILPMYGGDVFWLAIGGSGYHDGYRPVADEISFHYLGFEDQWFSVGRIKNEFFRPADGDYIAFVGERQYEIWGLQDYNEFKSLGGTYHGAPLDYKAGDPVALQ